MRRLPQCGALGDFVAAIGGGVSRYGLRAHYERTCGSRYPVTAKGGNRDEKRGDHKIDPMAWTSGLLTQC